MARRLLPWCVLLPPFSAAQTPAPSPTPSTHRIAGTVLNAQTGHPIDRARVSIVDVKKPESAQSMTTSQDGHFEFKDLPAAKFPLQGTAKGFITGSYDQHEQFSTAIVTGAGVDTEHLVLRLSPAAVLSGKVLDEFGDPVRHASVTVYGEAHGSGVSRIVRFRTTDTDDQGSYEIPSLDPGNYFLSVNATPWYAVHPPLYQSSSPNAASLVNHSLDVEYPLTYYADATNSEDATPIPIRGGDRAQVDLHLNPVPALHILFRMPTNPEGGVPMPQLQRRSFDGMESVPTTNWQSISEGQFELTGVPAGSYVVRSRGSFAGAGHANELDLTKDGQEVDTSAGDPLSTVTATVQLPAGASPPDRLMVVLQDSHGRFVAGQAASDDGVVNFADLAPGKYDLQAGSNQGRYSIARISSPNGETSGHTLTVPPGSALVVTLSLVGAAGMVKGFAKRNGEPAPGVMIVLVPSNPESNRELFRRDQSDLDGSFSLSGVIPGAYTAVAIENGWDLDWAQPAIIARYTRHGQPITVPDRFAAPLRLSAPVEVQPR